MVFCAKQSNGMETYMDKTKKEFSWKWYLVLVIIVEIITIFLTFLIWLDTRDSNNWNRLAVMPVWLLNSFIIFISSIVEFIKYKKYKANGCNVVVNIIIAIFSSIMLSIGAYGLNESFLAFLDGYSLNFSVLIYLGIGIVLIFPVFKHKT